MSVIDRGTADVTRYIMVVDSSDGSPETGATITSFDLQYTRAGESPVSKEDATALGATDTVHTDNKMIEVDATSSPGLYRVDWPDAAFTAGATSVLLVVTQSGFAPAVEDITLSVPVEFSTGAAISVPPKNSPNGFNITWGENEANNENSTHAADGTTHDIEAQNDTTEKIDVYYEFTIGEDGVPTGIHAHHQLDKGGGTGKNLQIYAYDWDATGWDQVGLLESGTSLETDEYTLFAAHVGTGSDLGKVRIRYETGSVAFTTTTKLLVDQILVEYTVVSRTVGGRIFIGTATGSSTSTKIFVQSGDPPSGGADDDYNNTLLIVWRGTDRVTSRVNVRAVTDYDDSDPSFTLDSALGFTPLANDLVEIYAADAASLDALSKLTTGFGTSVPDTLEGYLRAMMSKTASTPSNAGTYDAATDSLEFLGEGDALIKGSGFATGTDSLKQIRDAIDTLIAPAVVGASALSGSGFLSDCVTLVRQMTDEPSLLPKYTDADVVELVTSAMTVVMSEVHNNSDHNIINRFDIQLVPGQLSYIMPPNVGEVWAVRKMSLTTPIIPIYEVWSDNHWSSHQSGFVIEYNEFRLLTDWRSNDVLEMLYVPNGESLMHKATATSAGANTIIFPASVTDGTLDTRANAYAGYLVRILSDTTGYVQEKVIDTYDNVTRKATLTTAWSPLPMGTIVYEVLPTFSNIIKHCVCLQAAMDVLSNEGREKRLRTITGRYLVKIRALRQMITKKSSRFPSHGIGDTSDNDRRGDYYGWLV